MKPVVESPFSTDHLAGVQAFGFSSASPATLIVDLWCIYVITFYSYNSFFYKLLILV